MQATRRKRSQATCDRFFFDSWRSLASLVVAVVAAVSGGVGHGKEGKSEMGEERGQGRRGGSILGRLLPEAVHGSPLRVPKQRRSGTIMRPYVVFFDKTSGYSRRGFLALESSPVCPSLPHLPPFPLPTFRATRDYECLTMADHPRRQSSAIASDPQNLAAAAS